MVKRHRYEPLKLTDGDLGIDAGKSILANYPLWHNEQISNKVAGVVKLFLFLSYYNRASGLGHLILQLTNFYDPNLFKLVFHGILIRTQRPLEKKTNQFLWMIIQ